jgi:hypothetical protein
MKFLESSRSFCKSRNPLRRIAISSLQSIHKTKTRQRILTGGKRGNRERKRGASFFVIYVPSVASILYRIHLRQEFFAAFARFGFATFALKLFVVFFDCAGSRWEFAYKRQVNAPGSRHRINYVSSRSSSPVRTESHPYRGGRQ